MEDYYLWIKVVHIVAMISWFAGMFYLPRLFVYHAENRDNKEFARIVKIQERKLWKYISLPAFWTTLVAGLSMIAVRPELLQSGGWLHAKLTLVAALIGWFFYAGHLRKRLENDTCNKSGAFFRVFNEVPTLFLIAIVILTIIKPF
ncbi:MAG: protoporphyrinogen oxidase HemJ [Helicobacteraceae bacterium]|nr:protoporphyrinogen oxidase HemJ [Helicobacteraceae bacterium]